MSAVNKSSACLENVQDYCYMYRFILGVVNCTIEAQSYNGYVADKCIGPREGYVKLNGVVVWRAGWCLDR